MFWSFRNLTKRIFEICPEKEKYDKYDIVDMTRDVNMPSLKHRQKTRQDTEFDNFLTDSDAI